MSASFIALGLFIDLLIYKVVALKAVAYYFLISHSDNFGSCTGARVEKEWLMIA
jgi:hypothetical protein